MAKWYKIWKTTWMQWESFVELMHHMKTWRGSVYKADFSSLDDEKVGDKLKKTKKRTGVTHVYFDYPGGDEGPDQAVATLLVLNIEGNVSVLISQPLKITNDPDDVADQFWDGFIDDVIRETKQAEKERDAASAAKENKAKKPITAARSEKMAKVAKVLKKLQHATPATQEGLENELKAYIDPADYGLESIQEILYDVDGASARAKLSRQSGVAMSVFDDIQNVGKGNEANGIPRRPRAPKGWKWQDPLTLVRIVKGDWDVDLKGNKILKDAYINAYEYEDNKWEIVDYDPSTGGGHSGEKMSTKAASVFPPKVRVQIRMVEIARSLEK